MAVEKTSSFYDDYKKRKELKENGGKIPEQVKNKPAESGKSTQKTGTVTPTGATTPTVTASNGSTKNNTPTVEKSRNTFMPKSFKQAKEIIKNTDIKTKVKEDRDSYFERKSKGNVVNDLVKNPSMLLYVGGDRSFSTVQRRNQKELERVKNPKYDEKGAMLELYGNIVEAQPNEQGAIKKSELDENMISHKSSTGWYKLKDDYVPSKEEYYPYLETPALAKSYIDEYIEKGYEKVKKQTVDGKEIPYYAVEFNADYNAGYREKPRIQTDVAMAVSDQGERKHYNVFQYMTDDEYTAYLYLYGRYGKDTADEYVLKNSAIHDRIAKGREEKAWSEYGEQNPISSLYSEVGLSIAQVGEGFKNLAKDFKGEDINEYDTIFGTAIKAVDEGREESTDNKFAKTVYRTAGSMAANSLEMGLGFVPVAGKVLQGVVGAGISASDKYAQQAENGTLNDDGDKWYQGSRAEVLLSMGREAISWGWMNKGIGGAAKAFTSKLGNSATKAVLTGLITNTLGGAVTGEANVLADYWINRMTQGDNSNYNQAYNAYKEQGMSDDEAKDNALNDTLYAGLKQAWITGGIMGGLYAMPNTLKTAGDFVSMGKYARSKGVTDADAVVSARAYSRKSDAYKNSVALQKKRLNGGKLTDSELGAQIMLNKVESAKQQGYADAWKRLGISIGVDELGEGIEGKYDRGEITVAKNATEDRSDTVRHEIGHGLQHTNEYNDYMQVISRAVGYDAAVDNVKNRHAEHGKTISDRNAEYEVAADVAISLLPKTEAEVERLARLANSDTTLLDRVYMGVNELAMLMKAKGKRYYTDSETGLRIAYEDLRLAKQALQDALLTANEVGYNSASPMHKVKEISESTGIFDINVGTKSNPATQEDVNNYINYAYKYADERNNKGNIDFPHQKYGIVIGKADDRLVNDIKTEYGIDISNAYHIINDNDIRHTKNSHGEDTNEKYPVTAEDQKRIPDIIKNYDDVYYVSHEDGKEGIYYKKRHNGVTYYLEGLLDNRKTLSNKQMIKVPTGTIPTIPVLELAIKNKRSNIPPPNGETTPQTYARDVQNNAPIDNIPQPEADVNGDFDVPHRLSKNPVGVEKEETTVQSAEPTAPAVQGSFSKAEIEEKYRGVLMGVSEGEASVMSEVTKTVVDDIMSGNIAPEKHRKYINDTVNSYRANNPDSTITDTDFKNAVYMQIYDSSRTYLVNELRKVKEQINLNIINKKESENFPLQERMRSLEQAAVELDNRYHPLNVPQPEVSRHLTNSILKSKLSNDAKIEAAKNVDDFTYDTISNKDADNFTETFLKEHTLDEAIEYIENKHRNNIVMDKYEISVAQRLQFVLDKMGLTGKAERMGSIAQKYTSTGAQLTQGASMMKKRNPWGVLANIRKTIDDNVEEQIRLRTNAENIIADIHKAAELDASERVDALTYLSENNDTVRQDIKNKSEAEQKQEALFTELNSVQRRIIEAQRQRLEAEKAEAEAEKAKEKSVIDEARRVNRRFDEIMQRERERFARIWKADEEELKAYGLSQDEIDEEKSRYLYRNSEGELRMREDWVEKAKQRHDRRKSDIRDYPSEEDIKVLTEEEAAITEKMKRLGAYIKSIDRNINREISSYLALKRGGGNADDLRTHVEEVLEAAKIKYFPEAEYNRYKEIIDMSQDAETADEVIDMILTLSRNRKTGQQFADRVNRGVRRFVPGKSKSNTEAADGEYKMSHKNGMLVHELKHILKVRGEVEGLDCLRDIVSQQVLGAFQDTAKRTFGDYALSTMYINQLISVPTIQRNIISNISMIVDTVANETAVIPDRIMSIFTGNKAVGSEIVGKGLKDTVKNTGRIFKAGRNRAGLAMLESALDVKLIDGDSAWRNKRTYRGGLMGMLERMLGYALTVPDEFFKGTTTEAVESGLSRTKGIAFDEEERAALAKQRALERTFQDDNPLSVTLENLKKAANGLKIPVVGLGVGDLNLTYVKVASNVVVRGLEYTPIGAAKVLYDIGEIALGSKKDSKKGIGLIKAHSINKANKEKIKAGTAKKEAGLTPHMQRKLAMDIARPLTGTALLGLGIYLRHHGILIGDDEDDGYAAEQHESSKGLNGMMVNWSQWGRFIRDENGLSAQNGDRLVNISFLPGYASLSIGAQLYDNGAFLNPVAWTDATGNAVMNQFMDMPMTRSIQNIKSNWENTDTTSEFIQAMGADWALSWYPSMLNQYGNSIDDYVRNPYKGENWKDIFMNKVKAKSPWLPTREDVPMRVDIWGQAVNDSIGSGFANKVNNMFNPFKISQYRTNAISLEIDKLIDKSQDIVPKSPYRSYTFEEDGITYSFELNDMDYQNFSILLGQTTYNNMLAFRNSSGYERLTDQQKIDGYEEISKDTVYTVRHAWALAKEGKPDSVISDMLKTDIERYKALGKTIVKKNDIYNYLSRDDTRVEDIIIVNRPAEYTEAVKESKIATNNQLIEKIKNGSFYEKRYDENGKEYKSYSCDWTDEEVYDRVLDYQNINKRLEEGTLTDNKDIITGSYNDLSEEDKERVDKQIGYNLDSIVLPKGAIVPKDGNMEEVINPVRNVTDSTIDMGQRLANLGLRLPGIEAKDETVIASPPDDDESLEGSENVPDIRTAPKKERTVFRSRYYSGGGSYRGGSYRGGSYSPSYTPRVYQTSSYNRFGNRFRRRNY